MNTSKMDKKPMGKKAVAKKPMTKTITTTKGTMGSTYGKKKK